MLTVKTNTNNQSTLANGVDFLVLVNKIELGHTEVYLCCAIKQHYKTTLAH